MKKSFPASFRKLGRQSSSPAARGRSFVDGRGGRETDPGDRGRWLARKALSSFQGRAGIGREAREKEKEAGSGGKQPRWKREER